MNINPIVVPISLARRAAIAKSVNALNFKASGDAIGGIQHLFGNQVNPYYSLFWRTIINGAGPGNSGRIFDNYAGNYALTTTNGSIIIHQGGVTITSDINVYFPGESHDYAIVYDGSNIIFYRDGSPVSTKACTTGPYNYDDNNNTYFFNQGSLNSNYNGIVKDLMFYKNRALKPLDVVKLHNWYDDNVNRFIYWKMDQGSGSTVSDASGNGNAGTIVGAKWAIFEQ